MDRLNKALFPWLGPPPLGPYDEPVREAQAARCPMCGQLMSDHLIDRTGPRTMVDCPR